MGTIRPVYMGLGATSPILFGASADRGCVAAVVCLISLRIPDR